MSRRRFALLGLAALALVAVLVRIFGPEIHDSRAADRTPMEQGRGPSALARLGQAAHARPPDTRAAQRQAVLAQADTHRAPAPREAPRYSNPEWAAAWLRQIDRVRRSAYGDDIAAILRMPMRDAFSALEQLASEGDAVAAEALLDLASMCFSPSGDGNYSDDRIARFLAPADLAYYVSAIKTEHEVMAEYARACQAEGLGAPRLAAMLRARGLDASRPGADPFEMFREAFMPEGAPFARPLLDLLRRLEQDGAEMTPDNVLDLVASDPAALAMLTQCMSGGCEDVAEFPPDEREMIVGRAASLGDQTAIGHMIEAHRQAGEPVEAYAWAGFGAWLSRLGCDPAPGATSFLFLARTQQALRAQLTAADLAAAERRTAELIATQGAIAIAAQHCE